MNEFLKYFFIVILILLAILVVLCLFRALTGKRVADKVVASNMMGTIVIAILAILAVMLNEGYLADICIIYAMVSFLAVIILTKIYTGIYVSQHRKKEEPKA